MNKNAKRNELLPHLIYSIVLIDSQIILRTYTVLLDLFDGRSDDDLRFLILDNVESEHKVNLLMIPRATDERDRLTVPAGFEWEREADGEFEGERFKVEVRVTEICRDLLFHRQQ